MGRFVEGADRSQLTLLPECLEDWVSEDNAGDGPAFLSSGSPSEALHLRHLKAGKCVHTAHRYNHLSRLLG